MGMGQSRVGGLQKERMRRKNGESKGKEVG
jgi:hypothetical protein